MALDTLANVKTFLGESTTTYDSFLQLQIDMVSDAIEGYCGRKFAQADYTQTFYREDFDGPLYFKELLLYHYPLNSIATIVEKRDETDLVGTAVSNYRFHTPTAKLTKHWGSFFCNGRILEVTYNAGYATVPPLILSVFYGVIQERYNKKLNGIDLNFGSDVQRLSIPGAISIDFDYTLNNNERKNAFGVIIGSYQNVLDYFRSDRSLIGEVRSSYVS